jgi:predicted nucleotidyltransferase
MGRLESETPKPNRTQAKNELTTVEVEPYLERLLSSASADPEILAVILFGSSARDEMTASSDIDICLVFRLGKADRLALSRKRLEYAESDIDVQIFQFLPIYIRRRVLKEGKVLFCRDEEELYERHAGH